MRLKLKTFFEEMKSRDWRIWWKAAATRAYKTVCQTMVMNMGTNVLMMRLEDWLAAISGSIIAGMASLAMSVAGLPELKGESRSWISATAWRCVRTMAQSVGGNLISYALISQVDWKNVAIAAIASAAASIFTSGAGLPEAEEER